MALFMKQEFNPPVLSKRWLAMKFRPNMLIYSRHHVISILESGLMFREDSIQVEQEAPSPDEVWSVSGGSKTGWFTRGEVIMSGGLVGAAVLVFPPRSLDRSILANLGAYITIPVLIRAAHRSQCKGSLSTLLKYMRDYLSLARRAAACLKEYKALHTQIGSLTSTIDATHTLLCRQQTESAVLMSRASSALLGNAPWVKGDVAWDAVEITDRDNLMKIHHAFLVVQSTLLKHIAMIHFVPSPYARKLYKNHNERIYWLHNVLINHLIEEFKQNYDSLDRMYRLLKNSGNRDIDNKKLGSAVIDNWAYSDVHTGVARTCLELKLVLNKCNSLDMFLDSCVANDTNLDLDTIDKDLNDIIDNITKCLSTIQGSQLRLKKIRGKCVEETKQDGVEVSETSTILKIEDREPEVKDEVFYFVKTDDDIDCVQPIADLTTAPGVKEKENTKIVLGELRRVLGKREDVMRERERQALVKTMKMDQAPEFPRQIAYDDYVTKKGYIKKIKRKINKRRLFKTYKISLRKQKKVKYSLKFGKYESENQINGVIYEANAKLNHKSRLLTFKLNNNSMIITKWCKHSRSEIATSSKTVDTTDSKTVNNNVLNPVNNIDNKTDNNIDSKTDHKTDNNSFKFSKKDLDLTSSSDSEPEILNDVRKHRVIRRKNYPVSRQFNGADENSRPIEYSLGTGLAMASVLQVNSNAKMPSMAQEEVFIGDGEVSEDSGNDDE